ncbi:MAG: response regulator [Desulfobacterales bacterium]|nr:MAG: response regulator [Desulfobacterales bacterium]
MKKILIVDDSPEIVEVIQYILEAAGYAVIAAAEGQSGVKKALEESPDLIIMDIVMPKMSGGEAVKILKANEKTKDIPVIFLTGYFGKSDENAGGKGINVGGHVYPCMGKPVGRDELLKFISEQLKEI